MDKEGVDGWLANYIAAWKSYERDSIVELFAEDAEYRYHPYDQPVVGRDAIADSWVDEDRRDEPGTYDAHYRCIALDGDVAIATGRSIYYASPGGAVKKTYDNCYVMHFDDDGRCSSFTEWFMEVP